ncbi:MAG: hypothetical protein QOF71_2203 [Candidatus Eremiobacteraeota bacterium]|nr:hypothetical protein [Candidatus Eremiobacteraeota bacterium]
MGDSDDSFDWGTELGEGALKDAGVSLLGYGLSSLGVGFPNATDDAIGKLQSELNLIERQILSLKSEMDDVKTAIDRSEYDVRVAGLDSIMDSISDLSRDLHDALCISQGSPNTPRLADLINPLKLADKQEIMTGIETADLVNQLSVIHEGVTGSVNGVSLYQLLSNLIQAKHRFISPADCLMIKRQLDYYQNAQYTQLWLVVEYHRAKGATDFVQGAIDTMQGNVQQERSQFKPTPMAEGTVVDQKSNLMLYMANCPYVDFDSAQDAISQMNSNSTGGKNDWRLPTVAELLGDDDTVGIFSQYDNSDGTPPQWLTQNGFPGDITGFHFWTSIQVPQPDPSEYETGEGEETVVSDAYYSDYAKWANGGPPHYCVDSANLTYFRVDKPSPAHTVAVRNIQPSEKVPLTITNA